MDVRYFDDRVLHFIESIKDPVLGKVYKAITLLSDYGNHVGMPHSKKVSANIFELRTQGSPAIRIFYSFHDGGSVILHGFVKKSDKIPPRELNIAERRYMELVER